MESNKMLKSAVLQGVLDAIELHQDTTLQLESLIASLPDKQVSANYLKEMFGYTSVGLGICKRAGYLKGTRQPGRKHETYSLRDAALVAIRVPSLIRASGIRSKRKHENVRTVMKELIANNGSNAALTALSSSGREEERSQTLSLPPEYMAFRNDVTLDGSSPEGIDLQAS